MRLGLFLSLFALLWALPAGAVNESAPCPTEFGRLGREAASIAQRFRLRALRESDREDFMRLSRDPQVSAMDNSSYTDESLRMRFDFALSGARTPNGQQVLMLVIEDPSNGRMIGVTGGLLETGPSGTKTLIIAYAASPEYWGQGIVTEAVRNAMNTWLSRYSRLTDFGAFASLSNARSQAVLQRLGFVNTAMLDPSDLGMTAIRHEPLLFFQRPVQRAP